MNPLPTEAERRYNMGTVKITTFNNDGSTITKIHRTRCRKENEKLTATKGEYSRRKWGFIPFRKWARIRENNGGL